MDNLNLKKINKTNIWREYNKREIIVCSITKYKQFFD